MHEQKISSMEKMKSDTPLDYAVFQLSPKRYRSLPTSLFAIRVYFGGGTGLSEGVLARKSHFCSFSFFPTCEANNRDSMSIILADQLDRQTIIIWDVSKTRLYAMIVIRVRAEYRIGYNRVDRIDLGEPPFDIGYVKGSGQGTEEYFNVQLRLNKKSISVRFRKSDGYLVAYRNNCNDKGWFCFEGLENKDLGFGNIVREGKDNVTSLGFKGDYNSLQGKGVSVRLGCPSLMSAVTILSDPECTNVDKKKYLRVLIGVFCESPKFRFIGNFSCLVQIYELKGQEANWVKKWDTVGTQLKLLIEEGRGKEEGVKKAMELLSAKLACVFNSESDDLRFRSLRSFRTDLALMIGPAAPKTPKGKHRFS